MAHKLETDFLILFFSLGTNLIPVSIASGGGGVQFIATSSLSNFQLEAASNAQQQAANQSALSSQQPDQQQQPIDEPPPPSHNEGEDVNGGTRMESMDVPMNSVSDSEESPPSHSSHNLTSQPTLDVSVPMATQAVEVATIRDHQQPSTIGT